MLSQTVTAADKVGVAFRVSCSRLGIVNVKIFAFWMRRLIPIVQNTLVRNLRVAVRIWHMILCCF